MDETDKRLRDAADSCVKAYEAWAKARKDIGARETLQETVHELRKVAARVEIEVAASERDEMTQRQIPIPPHRASRRQGGDLPDFVTEGDNDSIGNSVEGSEGSRPQPQRNNPGRMQQQRRPMRRPQQDGNGD